MRRAIAAPLVTLALALPGAAGAAQEPPPIPADTEIHTTPTGLSYSILEPAKDERRPRFGDRVRVHFTGWLANGTMFETTRGKEPALVEVGTALRGWNQGLRLMGEGARFKLTIPAQLGYGSVGRPPLIPSNSTLIFEVELLELLPLPVFRPAPAQQEHLPSGMSYGVIRAGEGQPPEPGDVVTVRYALWNKEGKLLDCSERNADHRLKSKLSKLDDFELPFLEEAVGIMRAGAHYRFEVPCMHSFGGPNPYGVDRNERVVWELELESVRKPLPRPDFALFDGSRLTKLPSGLEYEILEQGSGPQPGLKSRVQAHYIGWLIDGNVFDASYDMGEPATLELRDLIAGLSLGLRRMQAGSTFLFRIPPELAYGGRGEPPYIGPNATLIFRVELISVLD